MDEKLLAELEDVLDAYGYRLMSTQASMSNNVRQFGSIGSLSGAFINTGQEMQFVFTAQKFSDGTRKDDVV